MDCKSETLFTIGEFSSRAGVTLRTLRYYDKIGLLRPCSHKESGHRLYSMQDFARLQKIMTLKFIGMSLDEIEKIIKFDVSDNDFRKSLEIQRNIMEKKVSHINMVKDSINEALEMLDSENTLNWEKFINIINVINMDSNWLEQYQNASNLRARIRIHELYSTNKYGWMNWFFDQLNIPENSKILELGCGDGSLWAKNRDRIPEGWDITLTDFSQGMLKDAKNSLKGSSHRFKFKTVDIQSIPFEDGSFDVVVANHMLYHVPDRERAFSEIQRVLRKGGYFFASTVGKAHMQEMREIINRFRPGESSRIESLTVSFQLENGMEQVANWFSDVKLKRYEDSLFIDKAAPLIDYMISMFSVPGKFKELLTSENLNYILQLLEDEISKNKGIYITKDTGYFEGRKV